MRHARRRAHCRAAHNTLRELQKYAFHSQPIARGIQVVCAMRCTKLQSETLTHHEWHPRPWDCSRRHHDPTRCLLDQSFETAPMTAVESARACSARSAAVGSSRVVDGNQQQTAKQSPPHARARVRALPRNIFHMAVQWQSTIASRVCQLWRTITKAGQCKL